MVKHNALFWRLLWFLLALSIVLPPPTVRNVSSTVNDQEPPTIHIVDSCGVIDSPGFYKIAGDLNVSNGNICLTVVSGNVTIDGGKRSITGFGKGVGIFVNASDVNITNTVLVNLEVGVTVQNASGVLISNSLIVNVTRGVSLNNSNKVVLVNNSFINSGLILENSINNTVINNTVNGKPLVYLERAININVKDAGQVVLIASRGVTVRDVVLKNTTVGVLVIDSYLITINNVTVSHCIVGALFRNSFFNVFANNSVFNNRIGLKLESSGRNFIVNNTVENNYKGLEMVNSIGNAVFLNDFINVYDFKGIDSFENNWSSVVKFKYTYIPVNKTYESMLGNYWSFCEKVDENKDGINDRFCELDEYNIDYFPLASRRFNYNLTIHAPTTPSYTPTRTTTPRPSAAEPSKPSGGVEALDDVTKTVVPTTVAVMAAVTLVSIAILTGRLKKPK